MNGEVQLARRRSRKGRAMGGMLMGIRREVLERGTRIEVEEEGIMMGRVKQGREIWRIVGSVGVYVGESMEKVLEGLRKWREEKEERVKTLIGGILNAKTRMEGRR